MLRTLLISLFTFFLALTSQVAAQVTLDPTKCYTLSTNGTQYLDSTNSVLVIQVHPDRAALEAGTDKGVRFHFPLGENGWVVCEAMPIFITDSICLLTLKLSTPQAHDEHYVGTTIPNAVEWATEDSLGSTVALATIHTTTSGQQAYLNAGPRKQMSSTAGVTTTQFNWDIQEMNCLLS